MTNTPAQITSLTGLRAVAAFIVVLGHAMLYTGFTFGANLSEYGPISGVMLFMVLSGYILAYVYRNDFVSDFTKKAYGHFIALRIARVYPVHITVLLILLCAFVPLHIVFSANETGAAFIYNVLLIHAWGVLPTWSWYDPSWSVSVEWFCYLTLPFLIRGFGKNRLYIVIYYLLLLGIYGMVTWPTHGNFRHGMTLVQYYMLFVSGVLAYILGEKFNRNSRYDWLAMISLIVIMVLPKFLEHFNLNALVYSSFIFFLAKSDFYLKKFFSHRIMLYLGETSYSLYMTHVAAYIAISFVFSRVYWHFYQSEKIVLIIGLLFGAYAGSFLMYYMVELPARRWLRTRIEAYMNKKAIKDMPLKSHI